MDEPVTSSRADERVDELKSGLADTFSRIEREVEDIIAAADEQARLMIEEAERTASERSEAIIAEAEECARDLLERGEREAAEARRRFRSEADAVRSRLEAALTDLHTLTEESGAAGPEQPPEASESKPAAASTEGAPAGPSVKRKRFLRSAKEPASDGQATAEDGVEVKLARMAARKMVAAGVSRDLLTQRIAERFDVEDPEAIVDEALGTTAHA